MVWSDLSIGDQETIRQRYIDGEGVKSLARQFHLKPQSLGRRMRKEGLHRSREYAAPEEPKALRLPSFADGSVANLAVEKFSVDIVGGTRFYEKVAYLDSQKPFNAVIFSDTHFGSEDKKAVDCFLRALKIIDFDLLIHAGDPLDLDGLSKYGKDRNSIFNRSLGKEQSLWREFNYRLSESDRGVPKLILGGNHMMRYYKWMDETVGITDLPDFELDRILSLEEFGYMPMVDQILFDANKESVDYPDPNFMVIHGTLSRKHSGVSSRFESEKRGLTSVVMGHVHRLSVTGRRSISGPISIAEAGCLRKLSAEYDAFPDWNQGFLTLAYDGKNSFLSSHQIVDGTAWINGSKV